MTVQKRTPSLLVVVGSVLKRSARDPSPAGESAGLRDDTLHTGSQTDPYLLVRPESHDFDGCGMADGGCEFGVARQ